MTTATQTAASTALFDSLQTGKQALKPVDGLGPDATRYGFIPIRMISGLNSNAFNMWDFPANQFVPLRSFPFPVPNANGGNSAQIRTANEQLIDFYSLAATTNGTDFPELAKLQNETAAREIFTVLSNPNPCQKYAYELKTQCATCWREYLSNDDIAGKIADAFGDDPVLLEAALATRDKLFRSLSDALLSAQGNLNESLKQIDDPKSGKDSLVVVDYLYIYHTHQDLPKYRTSTDSATVLTEALTKLLNNQNPQVQAAGLSKEDVAQMIAESQKNNKAELDAKDEEIRKLREQLESKELEKPKGKTK